MKKEYACTNATEAILKAVEVVQNGGSFLGAVEVAGFIYVRVEEKDNEEISGLKATVVAVDELTAAAPKNKRGKK